MSRTHVLVITIDRCPECLPDGALCADCTEEPALSYDIECPGVTDASGCRCWWECMDCTRRARDDVEFAERLPEEPVHGVQHAWIGGIGFCTPSDQCAVQLSDYVPDAASYVASEPGRYPVDFDFEDGALSNLHPLTGAAS